jgi:hypothetical protein
MSSTGKTMECLTKDALLQKPQAGLTFPTYGQQRSPFTLSGAPITTIPQSITGATEKRRKPPRLDTTPRDMVQYTATADTTNLVAYFAPDNYYNVNLSTENISGPDPNTTLRFNQITYTLKFSALHSSIWPTSNVVIWGGKVIQFSMVFISSEGYFFHLCIPVKITEDTVNENVYLKTWLSKTSLPSTGLTVNDALNFRGSELDVRFATLQYCLKYNAHVTPVTVSAVRQELYELQPYTLCMFKTPLFLSKANLPEWLKADPNLDNLNVVPHPKDAINTPYRRKTFNDIFNYVMGSSEIGYYIYNGNKDPYLLGIETHFDDSYSQGVVSPAYFKVTSASISGKAFAPDQLKEGVRSLNNVKCYPIDLASQVDDNGNIYIDETSKNPINTKDVLRGDFIDEEGANMDISGADAITLDQLKKAAALADFNSSVRYWIALIIMLLITLAIVAALVVYFFRAESFGGVAVTTAMAMATRSKIDALPAAAAPAAPATPAVPAAPATPAAPAQPRNAPKQKSIFPGMLSPALPPPAVEQTHSVRNLVAEVPLQQRQAANQRTWGQYFGVR